MSVLTQAALVKLGGSQNKLHLKEKTMMGRGLWGGKRGFMGKRLRETGCVGPECIIYVYEVFKIVHFKEKRKESLVVSKASHRGNP